MRKLVDDITIQNAYMQALQIINRASALVMAATSMLNR